ncbi:ABC1 family protein (nucleomorph) [Cryptomonas paramecium]|uniref:ABC1 family protein n=1 Tax=Cryptomonas paramaecium TaxID=2898 RepID=F2HI76_9CRYP|nr:ABC1 family protein [Cryptomonas paramecium]AEA39000.1 ABC1 family protein [Cryptomonas paramecium]
MISYEFLLISNKLNKRNNCSIFFYVKFKCFQKFTSINVFDKKKDLKNFLDFKQFLNSVNYASFFLDNIELKKKKKNIFFDKYFINVEQIFKNINKIQQGTINFQKKKLILENDLKKETILELTNLISNLSALLFLGWFLILFIKFFINRQTEKPVLPDEYDYEKISLYFELKPEKFVIRSLQICLTFISFFSILTLIQFFYCKNNNGLVKKFDQIKSKQKFSERVYLNLNKKSFRLNNLGRFLYFRNTMKINFYLKKLQNYKIKQFCKLISNLSPAFVKLTQFFVSKPNTIGESVVSELHYLQQNMPFFPNEIALNFMKKELGVVPAKIFCEISEIPVASANLGQVYKAKLDKMSVAVKVQRPHVNELIALDILLIRSIFNAIQRKLDVKTDLLGIVDEYGHRLFEELDYRKEAINMLKFRSFYGYMNKIYIPKVFLEYSTQHVLVMEWIEGNCFSGNSINILQENTLLIEVGIRCLLVQLLEVGFLHCDPCVKNLIKTKKNELAFIDFGLISQVLITTRLSLIVFFLHLINKEYELLIRDFTDLALIRNDDLGKEFSNLNSLLLKIFHFFNSLRNFSFRYATEKFFYLLIKYPFTTPPYFLNNLKAIATLEKIASMIDSRFEIVSIIHFYIMNRLSTNSSPVFEVVLKDFLTSDVVSEFNWGRLQLLIEVFSKKNSFFQNNSIPSAILGFFIYSDKFFQKIMIINSFNIFEKFPHIMNSFERFCQSFALIFSRKMFTYTSRTSIVSIFYKARLNIFILMLIESKLYSLKELFFMTKISFLSSALVFLETIVKNFFFSNQKRRSIMLIPIKLFSFLI